MKEMHEPLDTIEKDASFSWHTVGPIKLYKEAGDERLYAHDDDGECAAIFLLEDDYYLFSAAVDLEDGMVARGKRIEELEAKLEARMNIIKDIYGALYDEASQSYEEMCMNARWIIEGAYRGIGKEFGIGE